MELNPENLAELRERCYSFYDGVVVDIDLQLRAKPRTCVVTVQVQDKEAAGGWTNLRFTIRGVDEFRFELGRFTFAVLSFGIQFVWKGKLLYMVLAPAADETPELPDLTRNIGYVAGLSCEYELFPL